MAPDVNKSFVDNATNTLGVTLLSAALAFMPATGMAQNTNSGTQQVAAANTQTYFNSWTDVSRAAKQYVKDGGIAVTVSYGPFEGAPPPEVIGEKFIRALERRGEQAAYGALRGENPGYSISLTASYASLGPLSIDDMAAQLDNFVAAKKRGSELFAPE